MLAPSAKNLVISARSRRVEQLVENYPSEVNETIYALLEQKGIVYPAGFDFVRLIKGAIRKMNIPEHEMPEAYGYVYDRMFGKEVEVDLPEGGKKKILKTIFDYYIPSRIERPGDSDEMKRVRMTRWFYTAVSRLLMNFLKQIQNRQRELPTDFQPGAEEGRAEVSPGVFAPARTTPEVDERLQEMIQRIEERLSEHPSEHPLGETANPPHRLEKEEEGVLLRIFRELMHGTSREEIARNLGISATRLSYYLKKIKEEVKEYIIQEGSDYFAELLARTLGEPK